MVFFGCGRGEGADRKQGLSDGKRRLTDVATAGQLLRIIQSIPSRQAEPLKLWLAQVGRERIDETLDPELIAERLIATCERRGYTREWINQRLMAISARKELTDEWRDCGVTVQSEYAIPTDEITRAWSGMTPRQYKNLKGLKKESLRDNMSTSELVLNMLAEISTKEISQTEHPAGFEENREVARAGGAIAGDLGRKNCGNHCNRRGRSIKRRQIEKYYCSAPSVFANRAAPDFSPQHLQ